MRNYFSDKMPDVWLAAVLLAGCGSDPAEQEATQDADRCSCGGSGGASAARPCVWRAALRPAAAAAAADNVLSALAARRDVEISGSLAGAEVTMFDGIGGSTARVAAGSPILPSGFIGFDTRAGAAVAVAAAKAEGAFNGGGGGGGWWPARLSAIERNLMGDGGTPPQDGPAGAGAAAPSQASAGWPVLSIGDGPGGLPPPRARGQRLAAAPRPETVGGVGARPWTS